MLRVNAMPYKSGDSTEMRGKVIYRIACGTFSICMTYGAIVYAFRPTDPVINEPVTEWIEPVETSPVPTSVPMTEPTAVPFTGETEYDSGYGRKRGKNKGDRGGRHGGNGTDDSGEYYGYNRNTEIVPDSFSTSGDEEQSGYSAALSVRDQDSNVSASSDSTETLQQDKAGDTPPSLQEFLSALRCSGCRHNCSLLNPRCRKGKTKQQNATVQYQQTYGG